MNSRKIVAIVNSGDRIPFDGIVTDGCALVDESAQSGVSEPVLIDNTGGRNNVLAGTLVVDGWLKVESPIDARGYTPGCDDSERNDQTPEHSLNHTSRVRLSFWHRVRQFFGCSR